MAQRLPAHCSQDGNKVLEIIRTLKQSGGAMNERMATAASLLEGATEDDYYVSDSIGRLRVNIESFTPLMFVNNLIALAKASEKPEPISIATFETELEGIACRRGVNSGFPSIMYHSSDWIADNISRGNIVELTENFNGAVARTKSLDEMTRFRKNFAALSDSATFEAVRMTEMGFRTHRIPSLKKETIKKKELIQELRDGDIILLTPNRDGIDIYDMGVITIENGLPYLIHLSPKTHTVTKESEDLARYMGLMTKHFQGYRILRLKDD